jgi:hypothetical protein
MEMKAPLVEKLETRFSIETIWQELTPLVCTHPPAVRSPAANGWSLQSTPGQSFHDGWDLSFSPCNGPGNRGPTWNPTSPEDHLLKPVQDFATPTLFMTPSLAKIFCLFEEQGFFPRKARIIRMVAGSQGVWHTDGNEKFYQCRLHIPLVTNEGCFYEGPKERFHMPADGSSYLVTTTQPHRVVNSGPTDRYHIIAFIWDTKGLTKYHKYDPVKNLGEIDRMTQALTLVPAPRA